MYHLYGTVNVASFTPHICLVKSNADYKFIDVDFANKDQNKEEYLKLNPNGRVPTLVDNNLDASEPVILYETAAICLHLADHHPEAELLPPFKSAERSQAYKWLIFFTNSLQADLMAFHYADRYTTDPDAVPANRAQMSVKISNYFNQINDELSDDRSFLLGDTPYLVDYYLFMLAEWAVSFDMDNDPLSFPYLKPYLYRVKSLSEVQKTIAIEDFEPAL